MDGCSLVGRVFTNGLGDRDSILGRVIPKTLKMVLDTSLFNTQQYKVRIKGKMVQFKESSTPRLQSPTLLFTYLDGKCQLSTILTKCVEPRSYILEFPDGSFKR